MTSTVTDLEAENEWLKMELQGMQNVKEEIARILGLEDEPRWKWIVLEIMSLKEKANEQAVSGS